MNRRDFMWIGLALAARPIHIPIGLAAEERPQMRRWTDSTGRHTVMAEFVDLADGWVRLRQRDGKLIQIRLENLSPADQKAAQQMAARAKGQAIPLLWSVDAHDKRVDALAFMPDGKTLVSGGTQPKAADELKLWDVAAGKLTHTLSGQQSIVGSVASSPDGKTLASAGSAPGLDPMTPIGRLVLWEVATREPKLVRSAPSPYSPDRSGMDTFRCLAFSPNGRLLAVGGSALKPFGPPGPLGGRGRGSAGLVELWNTATGRQVAALEGHGSPVSTVAFSPDSRFLASGSVDKTIRLWSAVGGKHVRTIEGAGRIEGVVFSPDGKTLACAGSAGTVKLWDPLTGKLKGQFEFSQAIFSCVAYSPDGKILAAGGWQPAFAGEVVLWDAATGLLKANIEKHAKKVNSVAFSPDGKRLATGSDDGTVKLWDLTGI